MSAPPLSHENSASGRINMALIVGGPIIAAVVIGLGLVAIAFGMEHLIIR